MKNAIRFWTTPEEHTRTRIMATVGPKTLKVETLRAMVEKGASWFRFNGAHIETTPDEEGQFSYNDAEKMVGYIQELRNEQHRMIGIYFDLGGPKIRIQNVLAVASREPGDRDESWLHPVSEAKAVIRLYDKATDEAFQGAFEAFMPDPNDRRKFWRNETKVQEFFASRQSEAYELMLGEEVENFSEFSDITTINLKDGWCRLKIVKREAMQLHCTVEYRDSKFLFVPHQGANPHKYMFPEIITDKDLRDIDFALRMGADVISLSFVCLPDDARLLREKINNARFAIQRDKKFVSQQSAIYRRYIGDQHKIPIFAKIETAFAVNFGDAVRYAKKRGRISPDDKIHDPLIEIADRFDGLMVARGDLAVEITKYEVPSLQRKIIEAARRKNKPVIVATEMLESMKRGNASTRAEIGDINTAVWQGTDIVMLSGETASTDGKPEEVVYEMHLAVKQAERELDKENGPKTIGALEGERETEIRNKYANDPDPDREDLAVSRLSQGAQLCLSAHSLKAEAVLASAHTGEAVQEIAYYRPRQRIFAITDDVLTAVRLLQHRGVYPVVMEQELERTLDEFVEIANEIHLRIGIPVPDASKETFRLPGLLRIESLVKPVHPPPEIPNSIHEFTLPVKPKPIPEVEKKCVLSLKSHDRLAACLQRDAHRWQLVEQLNIYVTDEKKRLEAAKATVRVRRESVLDTSEGKPEEEMIKYILTLKGPSTTRDDGFDERQELEFDVTREYATNTELFPLPPVCRRHVTEHWRDLLADYEKHDVPLIKRAIMQNKRLRCTMHNGFILELDRAEFRKHDDVVQTHYELETEFHGSERTLKELEEYLHDKFARLEIPLVTGYPAKQVRVYLYAGLIEDKKEADALEGKIRANNELAARPEHLPCETCLPVGA